MPVPHDTIPHLKACRAAAQLGRSVDRSLADAELTPAAYRLLAYLSTGDVAAKVLAAKLAVSRPTITATLDWLEPRGYVTRRPDEDDRRRVEISLTEAGEAALRRSDGLVADRLAEVMESLDETQAATVLEGLEILHDALAAYRARGVDDRAMERS